MKPVRIQADSVIAQPWRNGGGQTRELLAWPPGEPWQLRISRADIEIDGPFSAFTGVQRWFTVLEGRGVALQFSGTEQQVGYGDAPLCFDGGAAPGCRLLDGPTQDLNLMARNGQGHMQAVDTARAWSPTFTVCGLYTCTAGNWNDGSVVHPLAAHTLLWQSFAQASPSRDRQWYFASNEEAVPPRAWWLGYSPLDATQGHSV